MSLISVLPQAVLLPLTGTSRYAYSQQESNILSLLPCTALNHPPTSSHPLTSSAQHSHSLWSHISSLYLPLKMQSTISRSHPHSSLTTSSSHQLNTLPQVNWHLDNHRTCNSMPALKPNIRSGMQWARAHVFAIETAFNDVDPQPCSFLEALYKENNLRQVFPRATILKSLISTFRSARQKVL
jgi:hypothetical protein